MNNHVPSIPKATDQDLREPAAMRVEAFLRWAGISRFLFYQEVNLGHILPKKCGARRVIPVEEAKRWLRDLPNFVKTPKPEQG